MSAREKLFKSIVNIVENSMEGYLYEIFVFGSQANKIELIAADIDIGIKADRTIDEVLINQIKYKLNDELASLYTFDVVDFAKTDKQFKDVALLNTENLYNDSNNSPG